MQTVVETPTFLRHAKRVGVDDADRAEIVRLIAKDPTSGDLIEGPGGARKSRFGRPGAGKSGGFRIITYYAEPDVPVFLLDIYGKGQKASLSKSEKNDLAKLLAMIAPAYRASAKAAAAARRENSDE